MFDLKTATMTKLDASETLVKYWQDKAKEEGEANLLIRQLTRRFGSLTENQQKKVRPAKQIPAGSLSIPELESLAEALFDFQDISDLDKWFEG